MKATGFLFIKYVMEEINKYKKEILKIDDDFEKERLKLPLQNNKPSHWYKKFYVKYENGLIKRYGIFRIVDEGCGRTGDYKLYSKNSGEFNLNNLYFSHNATNSKCGFDPYIFYYNADEDKYRYLFYNKVYFENEIADIHLYYHIININKFLYNKNGKLTFETPMDIIPYTNVLNPKYCTYFLYNQENKEHEIYSFDFTNLKIKKIDSVKGSCIPWRYTFIEKLLLKVYNKKILYDKDFTYFFFSYSDSDVFFITFLFCKNNAKSIEIIKNLFEDDTTINYKVAFDSSDIKSIRFMYSIIAHKNLKHISIFNYSIIQIIDSLSFGSKFLEYESNFTKTLDIHRLIVRLKNFYAVSSDEDLFVKLGDTFGLENLFDYNWENEHFPYNLQTYKIVKVKQNNKKMYSLIYNSLIKEGVIKQRWNSEYEMYKLIKTYFDDAIYQYREKWLLNQSLDVFIPSLNTAFEYQGIQHFQAIEYFGGEENFNDNIERDKRKVEICKQNNVNIVYWKYNEDISKDRLGFKLKEFDIDINNIEKIGIDNIDVPNIYLL